MNTAESEHVGERTPVASSQIYRPRVAVAPLVQSVEFHLRCAWPSQTGASAASLPAALPLHAAFVGLHAAAFDYGHKPTT